MSTQTTTPSPRVPAFELRHRLDRALESAGIGVEEIAEEIGRSVTTVRNYLNARTTPSRAVLIAWAFRCDVDLEWLETGQESQAPDNGPEGTRDQGIALDRCRVQPIRHLALAS